MFLLHMLRARLARGGGGLGVGYDTHICIASLLKYLTFVNKSCCRRCRRRCCRRRRRRCRRRRWERLCRYVYYASPSESTSYAAHLGGLVMGFLLGMVFLDTLETTPFHRYVGGPAASVLALALPAAGAAYYFLAEVNPWRWSEGGACPARGCSLGWVRGCAWVGVP